MAGWLDLTGFVAASILAVTAGPSSADSLAPHQWKHRVLLVISQQADPKLTRQRMIFNAMGDGGRERDLKLVEVIGDTPEAQATRARFDIRDSGFRAILIGKDGGDKLTSDSPLDALTLFPLIDAMPMRQDEMRRGS